MTRLVLAIVAATALSGCQHSGQQAIDPFWGRTTVPAPGTGSIGAPVMVDPGTPQLLQPPVITPGTQIPSGGLQPATQPNLLPAPTSTVPGTPGTVTPMPATPTPAGAGVPNYGAPAVTAPPSGYSNSGVPPSGSPGSPATMPGSGPASTYPGSPSNPLSPTTQGGYVPSTGGSPSSGQSPGAPPAAPTPAPAPAGSPPANPPPGYFPPDGDYRYHGSMLVPSGGNWVTPSGAAAAPVSLDGAAVSAPPGTMAGAGLDAGPSIIRIPTDGRGAATMPASAAVPVAPAP